MVFAVTRSDGSSYKSRLRVSRHADPTLSGKGCTLPSRYLLCRPRLDPHSSESSAMQITSGAVLGSSAKGFTGTPPAAAPATPNTGSLVISTTSSPDCDAMSYATPCLNPLVFSINSTTLLIAPTDKDFCSSDDGTVDTTALTLSGEMPCTRGCIACSRKLQMVREGSGQLNALSD